MYNVVLFEPEIPPNTGNIIRLCANTGCQLHLIEPLGFALDEKRLRRAGLDYAEWDKVRVHKNWQDFLDNEAPKSIWGLTTKATTGIDQAEFTPGDFLLFGPETRGLPDWLRESLDDEKLIRIPMLASSRSMNLSNAASVVVYEAWRQAGFAGAR